MSYHHNRPHDYHHGTHDHLNDNPYTQQGDPGTASDPRLNRLGLPLNWFVWKLGSERDEVRNAFREDRRYGHAPEYHPLGAYELLQAYIRHRNAGVMPRGVLKELLNRIRWLFKAKGSRNEMVDSVEIYCKDAEHRKDAWLKYCMAKSICSTQCGREFLQSPNYNPRYKSIVESLFIEAADMTVENASGY
ncbi:MAG: hypothetical protein Q9186_003514 [Xanthomendoza sp. 1 TL-2023]